MDLTLNSGGSRISQMEGAHLLFGNIFAKQNHQLSHKRIDVLQFLFEKNST